MTEAFSWGSPASSVRQNHDPLCGHEMLPNRRLLAIPRRSATGCFRGPNPTRLLTQRGLLAPQDHQNWLMASDWRAYHQSLRFRSAFSASSYLSPDWPLSNFPACDRPLATGWSAWPRRRLDGQILEGVHSGCSGGVVHTPPRSGARLGEHCGRGR